MPDVEIGAFTPERARRIWQATLAFERGIDVASTDMRPAIAPPIYFVNLSSHTVPPYGCIQVNGVQEIGSQNYLQIARPFDYTNSVMAPFLLNGPYEVEAGDLGVAQSGPIFRALTDGTSYACGTRLGPAVDSFELTKGSSFTAIAYDDIGTDILKVIACETPLLATAGSLGIAGNSSGTVTARLPSSGNWSPGTITYTAWAPTSTPITANAIVLIFPVDAKWVAVEIC
jgi:hypothetical protein